MDLDEPTELSMLQSLVYGYLLFLGQIPTHNHIAFYVQHATLPMELP